MLQEDVMYPAEQLSIEDITSPNIAAQILDLCDDADLFPETSGDGSGGGGICCYDGSSFPCDLSHLSSMDASTLSTLLDSQPGPEPDPDIILAVNYPSSQLHAPPATAFPVPAYRPNQQDHVEQVAFSEITTMDGYLPYFPDSLAPLSAAAPPSLPSSVFDDECVSSLSSYMGLEPSSSSTSCSFMDPTMGGSSSGGGGAFYPGGLGVSMPEVGMGFYPAGSLVVGQEPAIQAAELVEYQGQSGGRGGGGIYGMDNSVQPRFYGGSGDLQVLGDHHQPLVNGCGSPAAALASDMPSLEESTFKVGRLSVEERKERIHRYIKKRNERNFSKKIKYACRKTLADSRPRVRGRFAKNDEFGEAIRPISGHHEDEDEEEVAIKEEDDMIHSTEMYAHLSGMNTFKCNINTLESWT